MVTLKLLLPFVLTAFLTIDGICNVLNVESSLEQDTTWVSADISSRSVSAIKGHSSSVTLTLNTSVTNDVILQVVGSNTKIGVFESSVRIEEGSKGFNLSLQCVRAGNAPLHFETQGAPNASSPTHSDVVISNLKSIGFTLSCFRYNSLTYLSYIVGWGYFAVWTFSMYPQIYMNVRNRSVKGYSFCYLILNTIGYFAYSVYNVSFYWSSYVHSVFYEKYPESAIPVKLNDVCFAMHGFINCVLSLSQFYFFRSTFDQKMPIWVKGMIISLAAYAVIITCIFLSKSVGYFDVVEFLIWFSYIKIIITAVKYFPQAFMNFQRKSTKGFSIIAANADLSGGLLSIAQTITIAFNNNDWEGIAANPTKQALAILGVLYNVFYNFQHFLFYRKNRNPDLEYEEILKYFEDECDKEDA